MGTEHKGQGEVEGGDSTLSSSVTVRTWVPKYSAKYDPMKWSFDRDAVEDN